ncbi:hypothetical protein M7I_3445 [Glarea lozoyensis 74030]|uniref:Uncharacterized protein n=1 Tax=Glarea lozoyensis (strain ATCC 74030 / MF5533) TaxID=1104152 RepID=H0ELI1_GLAL7|nr:hypothetical protein M7I_3445 [Glarea lozoyensis 74030]
MFGVATAEFTVKLVAWQQNLTSDLTSKPRAKKKVHPSTLGAIGVGHTTFW